MKLNQKNLKETMEYLYANCKDSYDELWKAISTLHNLGLIDENMVQAAVKKDHELFYAENA